jgi:hypothetical protein
MLEFSTPMPTLSNVLSAAEVITITMQPHINNLILIFAEPNSTMKNCHPSLNWKVIYSRLMNHKDSPYLRKINATSTNMLTLPANTFITAQVALILNEISLRDNNKLSARFFAPLTQENNSNRPNNRPPNRHQSNQFPTPNRSNTNQLDR